MRDRDARPGAESPGPLIPEAVIPPTTFIVRLSTTAAGRVNGVVEHAGTGRKERFDGFDGLGPVLAALSESIRRGA